MHGEAERIAHGLFKMIRFVHNAVPKQSGQFLVVINQGQFMMVRNDQTGRPGFGKSNLGRAEGMISRAPCLR
jgi:hypothetical protein